MAKFQGPVRIEIPRLAVGGVFVGKAYLSSSPEPIATSSDANRIVSIAECITNLASAIEGDFSLNPLTIVAPNTPEII